MKAKAKTIQTKARPCGRSGSARSVYGFKANIAKGQSGGELLNSQHERQSAESSRMLITSPERGAQRPLPQNRARTSPAKRDSGQRVDFRKRADPTLFQRRHCCGIEAANFVSPQWTCVLTESNMQKENKQVSNPATANSHDRRKLRFLKEFMPIKYSV